MDRTNHTNSYTKTVSDIVRSDYRTADIFKRYGINYCCGGQISLNEACAAKSIDVKQIQTELENVTRTVRLSNKTRFNQWRLQFLTDYIIHIHHDYLQQTLIPLEAAILNFVNGHKKKYPYLAPLPDVFGELSAHLLSRDKQEEELIFPYIKQIENTYNRKEVYGSLFVRTLRKPISSFLESEQKQINRHLNELRTVTNHYTFATDACTNYQVIFRQLQELDNDIVQHKHLENNILFPKAINMEQELLQLD